MNMQLSEIIFIYDFWIKGLVSCITYDNNLQQWWFDVNFGLKYDYLWCFYDFYLIFKVFINIHKYANKMIYISDHRKNGLCLSFNLVPSLVFYDK